MKRQNFMVLYLVENRLFLLLSMYAVSFLLCFLLSALMPAKGENLYLLLLLLSLVAHYLPLLFFLRSEEGRHASLGMTRVKKAFLPELFLLCAAAFLLGTGGALFYHARIFPTALYGTVPFPREFSFLSFLALVLFSSFCEELLVRGALQTYFRSFGSVTALFASACFSAAFGFSLLSLPFWLLMGAVCAVARDRTATLFSSLACAVLGRLGIYLASLSVWQSVCDAVGTVLFSLLLVGAAVLCVVCALVAGRHKKKQRGYVEADGGKQRFAVVLSAMAALGLSIGASFLISII